MPCPQKEQNTIQAANDRNHVSEDVHKSMTHSLYIQWSQNLIGAGSTLDVYNLRSMDIVAIELFIA